MNEKLILELQTMLGRINAVHAGLLIISQALPKDVAKEAASHCRVATEKIHSDALASPVGDATVNEMHRVLTEIAQVLEATASQQ